MPSHHESWFPKSRLRVWVVTVPGFLHGRKFRSHPTMLPGRLSELAPIRHPAILALGLQLGDTERSRSCPGDSNPTGSPGGGQRGVTSAARLQPGPATRGSPWPLPRGARPGSCRTLLRVVVTGAGLWSPPPVFTCRVALRLGSPSGTIIAGKWTDGSGDPMGSSRCGLVWVATTGSGRLCEARSS